MLYDSGKDTGEEDGGTTSSPFEKLTKHFNEILNTSSSKLGFVFPDGGMDEQKTDESDKNERETAAFLRKIKNFRMKPREIKDFLDRFVIKQSEAKKVLSVTICDHYNHIRRCLSHKKAAQEEYSKPNVLLIGPTGVGKTYLIKNIAKLIGVPFVKVDATKFSETGYVGNDVDDMIRDLLKAADGNIEMAQYGIVFIDEIDKIAMSMDNGSRDVSGRGVQINLLKLMEESDVRACGQTDMIAQLRAAMSFASGGKELKQSISTKHILFIASGAFDKLADMVRTRIGAKSIGFNFKVSDDESRENYEYLQKASSADFIKYGFEPEFIGRLPVRVACETLIADDLKNILTSSEGSILKQYAADFDGYGIKFDAEDGALTQIAKLASEEKTGARGLLTVLEKLLRNFKFELPSIGVKSLKITNEIVEMPEKILADILKQAKPKAGKNRHVPAGKAAKTSKKPAFPSKKRSNVPRPFKIV
jgi:endopeptidase Clp ATP-binding regulatory subunit ClpX